MEFVTMDQLRVHTKADGDDDDLLELYGNAAENFCVGECELAVYADDAAMDAAKILLPTMLRDALAERDAALDAADDEENKDVAEYMRERARNEFESIRFDMGKIERGKVVGPSFQAAVLLIAAHLYRNREEVTSGINHGATKLPVGYKHMLKQFTRYGV